jgi:hypothetical protein
MRIGRTILAVLLALSLAMLPMAGGFAASSNEPMASDVVVASAHECCDNEALTSDHAVASIHDCCDHESIPADHVASAGCTAKCFNCYAVVFSGVAIPSPIGGTEAHFVKKPFYSRTASPPFRPPRA